MYGLGFVLALVASAFAAGSFVIWYIDSGVAGALTGMANSVQSAAIANLAAVICLVSLLMAAYCWLLALNYS